MMDALKAILQRRSIRQYTGVPVDDERMIEIVRAGMSAPSSRDTRHFRFVVINDPTVIEALAAVLPYAKMLLSARHAIVVASDLSVAHGGSSTDYWVQDCAAAAENILVAATALGLGACWTAAHPRPERVAAVKEILRLPETVMPLCVIAVGVPSGEERPRDKFDPSVVSWNEWGRTAGA